MNAIMALPYKFTDLGPTSQDDVQVEAVDTVVGELYFILSLHTLPLDLKQGISNTLGVASFIGFLKDP